MTKKLTSYTIALTDAQGKALETWLRSHDFELKSAPHARFAAAKGNVVVVLYASGKAVVQGKGTQEFVEFVLEPHIIGEARLGYEEVLDPDWGVPRLGIDESGKGDFFGPLCVAGAYVNEAVARLWKNSGIRDSKTIGSDRKILELAELIQKTPGCVQTTVCIGNPAYNRLHAKMRNVNDLLAWGHARAIENLLGQKHRMNPPPVKAISDQFARTEATVRRALMNLGRGLELVQKHKAESDMAVAAASILARAEFVRRLGRLGAEYGVVLPKGASPAVEAAGRELVQKHGIEALDKVAKKHFRTASRVSGGVIETEEGAAEK